MQKSDEEARTSHEDVQSHTNHHPQPKKPVDSGNDFWDLIKFTFIALIIVIPLRLFIAQPFVVSGESMHPTFENGDYLIVDEISYRFNDPQRGDVIIFRYPRQPSRFFIKRIIGLPGESLSFENNTITVTNDEHPQGVVWEEPYLHEDTPGTFNLTLGSDEYFVMGDNRDASSDSRIWGPLPAENIIGRAAVRLLPLGEISILPGDYKSNE